MPRRGVALLIARRDKNAAGCFRRSRSYRCAEGRRNEFPLARPPRGGKFKRAVALAPLVRARTARGFLRRPPAAARN